MRRGRAVHVLDRVRTGGDVSGYHVEAVDGGIGKVDDATYDDGTSCLVVDTGPLDPRDEGDDPAASSSTSTTRSRRSSCSRTKDEIKHAPEYDDERLDDAAYRDRGRRLLRAGRRSESGAFRRLRPVLRHPGGARKPSQIGVRIT